MLISKAAKASYCAFQLTTYALSACGGVSLALTAVFGYQALRLEKKTVHVGSELRLAASEQGFEEAAFEDDVSLAFSKVLPEPIPVLDPIPLRRHRSLVPAYTFSKELFAGTVEAPMASGVQKAELVSAPILVVEEYEAEGDLDQMALRQVFLNAGAEERSLVPSPVSLAATMHPQNTARRVLGHSKKTTLRKKKAQERNKFSATALDIQSEKTHLTLALDSHEGSIASLTFEDIRSMKTESNVGYSDLVALFQDESEKASDATPIQVQPLPLGESGLSSAPLSEKAIAIKPVALLALADGYPKKDGYSKKNEVIQVATQAIQRVSNESHPIPPEEQPTDPSAAVGDRDPKVAMAQSAIDSAASNAVGKRSLGRFSIRIVGALDKTGEPLADVTAQVLGSPVYGRSDDRGMVLFDGIFVEGLLPVVLSKEGFLSRRAELHEDRPDEVVGLISKNTAKTLGDAAGEAYREGSAIVAGEVRAANGKTASGIQVQLSALNGSMTYKARYFSEAGELMNDYAVTAESGKFAVLNVQPGTYLMTMRDLAGVDYASRIVHVSPEEGIYRVFSAGEMKSIAGRVVNLAANAVVKDASVQLLGQRSAALTSKNGRFALGPLYVDCSELNYLQVDKPGFYRNRVDYACDGDSTLRNVFAVPASPVNGDAMNAGVTLDASTGAVIGHVSSKAPLRMQLWGADETRGQQDALRGKDFYYAADGVLRPEIEATTSSGRFTIFDAPEGLSYVQAVTKDGQATVSYWPILISPSTVNVYLQ